MIHITEDQIQSIVRRLAGEIKADYPKQNIMLLGVLNGAYRFLSDLSGYFSENVIVDTTKLGSYNGTKSTGNVKMILAPTELVAGSTVILVEDLIDTGLTMREAKYTLLGRGAKEVKVCALLDKPSGRKVEFVPDYVGTKIGNEFVIGYGMDYKGHGRTLNHIRTITDEELKKW